MGQVLNCLLLRNNCAVPHGFCTNELIYCYCKPTKLQECTVFSPVCLSVILSVHMMGIRGPLNMFKLGPNCTHCNNTPASKTYMCEIFPLCRQAGGWHSTEMPSCILCEKRCCQQLKLRLDPRNETNPN